MLIQRCPPQDMILYQTERYHMDTFGYDIPIKGEGNYVLILKFSEVWFAAPNQKVFDVLLNGEHIVVPSLDIFAQVGRGVAHDEIVPFEISGKTLKVNGESSSFDGTLSVEFVKTDYDNPKINAIYVMKGSIDDVPKLPAMPQKKPDSEWLDEDDNFDNLDDELTSFNDDEDMSDEDAAMLEHQELLKRAKRQQEHEETVRKSHHSGKRAADPFESDDMFMSSTFLPIVAAIVAFIPLIVCLWKL